MPGITEIQLPGEQVDRQQGKHKPDFSAVRNNFKMVFDVIDVVFVCPTETDWGILNQITERALADSICTSLSFAVITL